MPRAAPAEPARRRARQAGPRTGATAAAGTAQARAAAGTDAAVRVLRQFRSVFNAVKTHFQQVEKKAGIGGAQVWALSVIRDEPGIGIGALARALDVHQTTASNLVRSLVEQGFAQSHRSGIDRRASQLKITRTGQRLLARAPGPFTGVLPQALRKLDGAALKRLEADLATLLRLLHANRAGEKILMAPM